MSAVETFLSDRQISRSALAADPAAVSGLAAKRTNVAGWERLASGLAGGGLIATALLGRTNRRPAAALVGAGLLHRAVTGNCLIYRAVGINTANGRSFGTQRPVSVPARQGRRHEVATVVRRPREQLFAYWRALENLPILFEHLVNVVDKGGGRSHWVARGPLGKIVEWDAEIHNEKPSELIAWRSLPGGDLDTAGSVRFDTNTDGGTIVTLNMKYDPPAGTIGDSIASLLGNSLSKELQEGLRRFKQIAEAGEVPSVSGQPRGSCR